MFTECSSFLQRRPPRSTCGDHLRLPLANANVCVKSFPADYGLAMQGMDVTLRRLLEAGIVAVINLAVEEPSPILPRTMTYCHFPIMDAHRNARASSQGRSKHWYPC